MGIESGRAEVNSRKMQAELSKAKIIKTSFELFESRGIGNVSIESICNAAQISNGAFYHHFSSRDQLVVLYTREPLHSLLESRVVPKIGKKPTRELILTFFESIFAWIEKSGVEWSKTYYVSSLSLGKNDSYVSMVPYSTLLKIFEKGRERNEVPKTHPASFYTEYLFSILNGMSISWCQQGGETDLLSNGKAYIEMAFDSIAS